MARPFWKGAISFGLVNIPVKMSLAIESKTPGFHYLHEKCLTRPKQVLYCEKDNEYFSTRETVRGYEYAKGQFVVLEEEDFEKVPVKTTRSIEISAFARQDEIDPIYYTDAHYLEPEELGVKPFILLRDTLLKKGLLGIAKVVFQRREHLCCLRPKDEILVLNSLHFANEILPADDLVPPTRKVSEAEMDMAGKLVDSMTTGFKPEKYRDEYTLALLRMVEAKLKGVEVKVPEAPQETEIEDLMEALKASVAAAGK
jgi:DNA end-binding protein Ku